MKRFLAMFAALAGVSILILGCSSSTPTKSTVSSVSIKNLAGSWDANGKPVNGGPKGANGSTGNNLTQEYCARNQNPACPSGSYVSPNAILNPNGSHTYVPCEGTICTNPNHGAGPTPGKWDSNGNPVNGGPQGADGSSGNHLSKQYCAQNQDPGCPAGSYVGPNAIPNPNGNGQYVPCEGTICTNPNHGAGTDPNQNGGDSSNCQGTICTNPNHGAGTDPNENGGDSSNCQGTICTNPNHGAGTDPNENGGDSGATDNDTTTPADGGN